MALYHVVGFTPEAPTKEAVISDDIQPIIFDQAAYDKTCEKFSQTGPIDFVVLGCPHVSINEFEEIAGLVRGKKLKSALWVCTSRMVRDLADRMGFVDDIVKAGGEIICDTCPVLCCTLTDRGYKTVATNSGKMAHYAPGLWNLQPVLLSTSDCIRVAVEGKWGE